tara:strand:- start:9 stop:470 length:462 start_codon:yes stop_codon:yes gene_type:complete
MKDQSLSKEILSKKILQTRHDHYLQIEDLAALSGLSMIQIESLEQGMNNNCFVDSNHAVDCTKRLATSFGFSQNYFLQKTNNLTESSSSHFLSQKKIINEKGNASNENYKLFGNNPILDLDILKNIELSLIKEKINDHEANKTGVLFWIFLIS